MGNKGFYVINFPQSRKNTTFLGQWLALYHTIPTFNDPRKKPFENITGKGENGGNHHFLLSLQCFLPILKKNFCFIYIYFVGCKRFQFGRV